MTENSRGLSVDHGLEYSAGLGLLKEDGKPLRLSAAGLEAYSLSSILLGGGPDQAFGFDIPYDDETRQIQNLLCFIDDRCVTCGDNPIKVKQDILRNLYGLGVPGKTLFFQFLSHFLG